MGLLRARRTGTLVQYFNSCFESKSWSITWPAVGTWPEGQVYGLRVDAAPAALELSRLAAGDNISTDGLEQDLSGALPESTATSRQLKIVTLLAWAYLMLNGGATVDANLEL